MVGLLEKVRQGARASAFEKKTLALPFCSCFFFLFQACIQSLCNKCCIDDNCTVHREQREKAAWKDSVMKGTSDVQQKANLKRSKIILAKRFKEPHFKYMGDTVVIWDLRTCLDSENGEEILRKAHKRKIREHRNRDDKGLRNNRKRFWTVYEQLFQKSLKNSETSPSTGSLEAEK